MLPDDEVDDDEVGEEVEGEVDVGEVGDNVGDDMDDGEMDNDVDDETTSRWTSLVCAAMTLKHSN